MIIIGSTAIKYWFPDFKREPKDYDIIVGDNEEFPYIKGGVRIEKLKNSILQEKYKYNSNPYLYPNDLCTLKASHLCWDINWDKHMFDLQFLFSKDCKIDEKLFWELYEYWNEVHGKK